MRKLLLASAAMLGAASGIAQAQAPAAPPNMLPYNATQGFVMAPSAGGPAANNANNTQVNPKTYVGPSWIKTALPEPGTVVIRLNGRVQVHGDYFATTGNVSVPSVTPAVAAKLGTTTTVGGVTQQTSLATAASAAKTQPAGAFKISPLAIYSYVRLYPGVDGMATNGLRYGAAVELRTTYQAGVSSSNVALNPSANDTLSGMFVRRNFVYLAADKIGLLRVGQTDGLGNLFDNGTYSMAGGFDGGVGSFNAAMMESVAPSGPAGLAFPYFRDNGSDYDTAKIVYMTPQFFGFDAGIVWAPNMGDGNQQNAAYSPNGTASNCQQANPSCIGLTTGLDGTRWYNLVNVGLRWQGKFGPVDMGIYGIYATAGKESVFGGAVNKVSAYDNLSEFNIAAFTTYNSPVGAFTVSANYVGGAANTSGNNGFVMRPSGGAPLSALLLGLTWKNGPLTLGAGANYVNSQGSGNTATGAGSLVGISQRREFGWAFGGSYTLAPGLVVAAEYMYIQRHQGQFDFMNNCVAGASGCGATGTRDAKAQGFMLATAVTW